MGVYREQYGRTGANILLGIIVNVSGAFASFALMPSFYQYGYAIPFYHSVGETGNEQT